MPVAALAAGAVGRGLDDRARGAAGAVLCAGGLAALGLLPGVELAWTHRARRSSSASGSASASAR